MIKPISRACTDQTDAARGGSKKPLNFWNNTNRNGTMKTYRMLDEAGNETWRGKAHDVGHAEEKCFWDESPGSLERFTLQVWGQVKVASRMSAPGWVTIYKNECLAAY